MFRFALVLAGCLWPIVQGPVASAFADEGPRLSLHLVATFEYPSCSHMIPTSIENLEMELDRGDLEESKGFGYICFLVHGVEGLTGLEFALDGLSKVDGLKVGRIEWCVEGALQMGDFLEGGGIVAFPCVHRLRGDEFMIIGRLPFEYGGAENLNLDLGPSSFSRPGDPTMFILDCSPQYAEHEIVETSGGVIEGVVAAREQGRRAPKRSNLLWSMGEDGRVTVNNLGDEHAQPEAGKRFPSPWVSVGRTVARVDPEGRVTETLEGAGVRWVLPSESRDRVLRLHRRRARETRAIEPWDLELLSAAGEVVFRQPDAGRLGWISADGSRVAWQEVEHAGRLKTRFHLWEEGRGEFRIPAIGLHAAGFLRDGTLVGWGVALADGVGGAQGGQRGVFALGRDGRLAWWNPTPGTQPAAFAVSEARVVLASLEPAGDLVLEGWTIAGQSLYSKPVELGDAGPVTAGRLVSAVSRNGAKVALAWAPRGGLGDYTLALFDGKTGGLLWERDVCEDLAEEAMAPGKVTFSGDGGKLGVLSFRMGEPPASAVTVYDSEGTLTWRRVRVDCTSSTHDLLLSEQGDEVLFTICNRAFLYRILPVE